jgi:hypothetical protein
MIEIRDVNIPCYFYSSIVAEHEEIKVNFLDQLKNFPIYGIDELNQQRLYNTDFFINNLRFNTNFNYNFVLPSFTKHNKAVKELLQYSEPGDFKVVAMWYQQYKKGDYHFWHNHPWSVFSNIYYVDLPAGVSHTSFRFLGQEFEVEVQEGQILTFPSFLEHCSKPNLSDNIKTVISFNSN